MDRLFLTTVLLSCPACSECRLYDGVVRLKEHCGVCQAHFARYRWGWSLPALASFFLVGLLAWRIITILYTADVLDHWDWVMAISVATLVAMFPYRHLRALDVWIHYMKGRVYRDALKKEEYATIVNRPRRRGGARLKHTGELGLALTLSGNTIQVGRGGGGGRRRCLPRC